MIAAGSLFTSCVENTEPQGIRDLREAKADYLASLSKLREADAEKVKAEAAVEQAKAEVQKAIAAQNQALAEAQQIANEAASIQNEVAAAQAKAKIEKIKAKAEEAAVKAQQTLAEAQAALDKALRKIAAEAIGLTGDEKYAITEKTFALNMAYGTYNAWLDAYNGAVKDLWEAEYAVAAGKEGYETADSYRDAIADVQAQIAELEADIASYEALKAEPAGIKDTLDAIAEEITALDAEIATKENVRKLYEASVPFKDAKDEFAKRVETFKNDSLKGADFKFVDVDEEGNDVPVEYELTDGLGVDGKFGQLINNAWRENKREGTTDYDEIYSYLPKLGFYYNKSIEVGYKYESVEGVWKNPSVVDEPETLEEGLDVLDKIVETLNRELVVVDNIKDSTSIEDAKKAAHIADSTYKADRKILEIGFEKSTFAKKVTDSLAKLAADTVAEKAKYTAADADLKTKVADKEAKESAKIVAVRTAAAAYNAAVDAMATAVRDYDEEKDSAAFIKAIQAFGQAQAALNGYQDSLSYKSWDPYTGTQTTSKDAFSAVNPKFFVKGEEGHPVYNESFPDIVKIVFGDNATLGTKKKELVAGLKYNPLKEKGTATDSINVLKEKNQAVKAAVEAYAVAEKAATRAGAVRDSIANVFTDKVNDFNTYKASGTDEAKAEYTEVYNKFWGYSETHVLVDDDYKPYKFTWTDKTFLEPENCVEFTYQEVEGVIYPNVLKNSALQTILDNVDPDGYNGTKIPNKHRIFKHYEEANSYNLTEFAKALFAAQIVEDLGEYVPNKARLEKINAQVAQIREDVEAAIAEYEAGSEGLKEVSARFYGVDEDGEILEPDSEILEANNVDVKEGKWAFGGYLLAWAEELAPEYPGIVKEAVESIKPLQTRKHYLANFKWTLDKVYTAWWNEFEKEGKWNQRSVASIVKFFENKIDDLNDQIDVLNGEIAGLEELIDACEAGYSPAEAKVAPLKKTVEAYKKYLAQAEEALARAQKEYDEVIAKYGVNE